MECVPYMDLHILAFVHSFESVITPFLREKMSCFMSVLTEKRINALYQDLLLGVTADICHSKWCYQINIILYFCLRSHQVAHCTCIFPSIWSISHNKSLHLERTAPETCATTASFGRLSPRWHTCGCEMPWLSFEATLRREALWRDDGLWGLSGSQEMSHVFWTYSLEREGNFFLHKGFSESQMAAMFFSCCYWLNN